MSIVSVAEAVPNRLMAIYGALLARSGGETRERLREQMAPPSLRGGRDNQSTAIFDASLREARAIGLVTEDGGNLTVPPEAQPKPRQGEEEAFRAHVLRVLCDEALADETGQSKVAPAIAWLLMQDPLRPLPWNENPLPTITRQLADGEFLDLGNASRLQTLAYWARYLGFARLVGAGQLYIVPDPHDAIERFLPSVFDIGQTLRASEFRKRLADGCPLLESGSVRARVEQQASDEVGRAHSQRLSRSTSLALLRLESSRQIELQQRSDAEVSLLDLGTSERRFSHVVSKSKGRT
jgi:hypothetical protein